MATSHPGARLAKRVARIAAWVVGLAVLAIVLVLIALQTPWGHTWLRNVAASQTARALGANVTIERLTGNLLSGVVAEGIHIGDGGEAMIRVERVAASYDALALLTGNYSLSRLAIEHPVIPAHALARLIGTRRTGSGRSTAGFSIDTLAVSDGEFLVGSEPDEIGGFRIPDTIRDVDAELKLVFGPNGIRVEIRRLSFTGSAPDVEVRHVSGNVTYGNGDLTLQDFVVRTEESSFQFGGRIANIGSSGSRPGVPGEEAE